MFCRSLLCLLFACLLPLAAAPQPGRAAHTRDKTIWNYDGGLALATDGEIPEGPCFRLAGRVIADDFFENLRREDTSNGTLYRRGNDVVTEFPGVMHLIIVMYDRPCAHSLQQTASPGYLNKTVISSMRLNFSWKRGMELRPARDVSLINAEAHRILPYAFELAKDLPERYEWRFDFDVPSKAVPLTDSLVLVINSPSGHIIARVAARL
jgi:hypothetical protein